MLGVIISKACLSGKVERTSLRTHEITLKATLTDLPDSELAAVLRWRLGEELNVYIAPEQLDLIDYINGLEANDCYVVENTRLRNEISELRKAYCPSSFTQPQPTTKEDQPISMTDAQIQLQNIKPRALYAALYAGEGAEEFIAELCARPREHIEIADAIAQLFGEEARSGEIDQVAWVSYMDGNIAHLSVFDADVTGEEIIKLTRDVLEVPLPEAPEEDVSDLFSTLSCGDYLRYIDPENPTSFQLVKVVSPDETRDEWQAEGVVEVEHMSNPDVTVCMPRDVANEYLTYRLEAEESTSPFDTSLSVHEDSTPAETAEDAGETIQPTEAVTESTDLKTVHDIETCQDLNLLQERRKQPTTRLICAAIDRRIAELSQTEPVRKKKTVKPTDMEVVSEILGDPVVEPFLDSDSSSEQIIGESVPESAPLPDLNTIEPGTVITRDNPNVGTVLLVVQEVTETGFLVADSKGVSEMSRDAVSTMYRVVKGGELIKHSQAPQIYHMWFNGDRAELWYPNSGEDAKPAHTISRAHLVQYCTLSPAQAIKAQEVV